ncbi:MAG: ATP synthase F1 subunit epsilon [Lachnospiraceae bacterium]|nr:ATP synthase F1 subunit epsilon [Lachnospiraceae bacterium]
MENTREFKLEVVTPQAVFYSDYADMVEMKTTEGEMGVYKGHIPLTAVVAPGTLRIHKDNEVKEAVLLDGIIRVLEDSVTILAEACEWADEIDLARAMEAKIRAERRLKGAEGEINVTRAELALRRSLARIELAEKYKNS